jgi:5-methylcytosine-specific restriction endonuclease McrA
MKSKKSKLQSEADRLWFNALIGPVCEVCGGKAVQVHHFFYKGSYGHLRYNLDNGISICQRCHFLIHFKDPKIIEEKIITKRGKEWFEELKKLANKRPPNSYKTIGYYLEIINNLK